MTGWISMPVDVMMDLIPWKEKAQDVATTFYVMPAR
jgi:hypothetical protein